MAEEDSTPDIEILLRNAENENSQFVKSIGDEFAKIEALQLQHKASNASTNRLDELTDHLDQETKNLHLQFTQSRDIIDSLKRALSLLGQKEMDLEQKFSAIKSQSDNKRKEQQNIVERYTDVFLQYQSRYEMHPLAQERKNCINIAQQIEHQVKDLCEETNKLKIEADNYKAKEREPEEYQKLLIRFAQSRINVTGLLKEVDKRKMKLKKISDQKIRPTDNGQSKQLLFENQNCSILNQEKTIPLEEQPPRTQSPENTEHSPTMVNGTVQARQLGGIQSSRKSPPTVRRPQCKTPTRPLRQSPLIAIPKLKSYNRKPPDTPVPKGQLSTSVNAHRPHRLIRTPPPLLFCQPHRDARANHQNNNRSVRVTEKLQTVSEIETPPIINMPRMEPEYANQTHYSQAFICQELPVVPIRKQITKEKDAVNQINAQTQEDHVIEVQMHANMSSSSPGGSFIENTPTEDTRMDQPSGTHSLETPLSSQDGLNAQQNDDYSNLVQKQFQSIDQSPGFMFQARPMFNNKTNNFPRDKDHPSPDSNDGFSSTDSFFTFANQTREKQNEQSAGFMFSNHGSSPDLQQTASSKPFFGQADDNEESSSCAFSFLGGMATRSSPSQTNSGFQFNFNSAATSSPTTPSTRFSFL